MNSSTRLSAIEGRPGVEATAEERKLCQLLQELGRIQISATAPGRPSACRAGGWSRLCRPDGFESRASEGALKKVPLFGAAAALFSPFQGAKISNEPAK